MKRCIVLLMTLSLLFMLTACGEKGADGADASQQALSDATEKALPGMDTADLIDEENPASREELRLALRDTLMQQTSLEIMCFDCLDFNQDGQLEAFAVVAENAVQSDYNSHEADKAEIWFISQDSCIKIDTWDDELRFTDSETFRLSENRIGWAVGAVGAHALFSNYTVTSSGQYTALPHTQDAVPEYCGAVPDNTLMLNLGKGAYSMPQYFYFDEEQYGFVEYGGIEITKKQLSNLGESEKAFEQIRSENGAVESILYRQNGIININYTVNDGDQRFITLIVNADGSVVFGDQIGWSSSDELYTNGGYYVPSLLELADTDEPGFLGVEYPDSFPY